jgi:type VI secretion system protein ImpA
LRFSVKFDVDAFLQPISEQHKCGEDLSFSNDFHEIKQAKTQDDILLDQGDWVTEPKQADWSFVAIKSTELLQNKTKDIRLFTWITESWAHLYGFEGIEKALTLSYRILEEYWLELHPLIEEDDLDQRLGLLQGLITQLPSLIKQVPLTTAQPFYTLADYDKRLYQQNLIRKSSDDFSQNDKSNVMEEFDVAINATNKSFQLNHFQSFQNIFEPWEKIKFVLDSLMGLEAPSFANVDTQLSNIQITLKKIYRIESVSTAQNMTPEVVTSPQQSVEQTHIQEMAPIMNNQSQYSFQATPQSHIQNREQALVVLNQIAQYFKENEPHSPVSYMLEKTIKWSQMPLHEWLNQVIKNDNPLDNIQELLGVKQDSNESNNW